MNVTLAEKFISKLMDEAYDSEVHGFRFKKLLDRHNIPYEETDKIYTLTYYDKESKSFKKPLLKEDSYRITLYEMLKAWDLYLQDPIHEGVYLQYPYQYSTKVKQYTGEIVITKKGKEIPLYVWANVVKTLECDVVEYINLFIEKQDGSIKVYKMTTTSKKAFPGPSIDPSNYEFHIMEEV